MDSNAALQGVEDTLYIPLLARIYVSERFPEFFYDEKALSLKPAIPENTIVQNTGEYFSLASACRQYVIDKKIRDFVESRGQCNVVCLGAGLETALNRMNTSSAHFYQVDVPKVIDTRARVLGCAANETLVAGDMFTLEWVGEIDTSLPTLITVSGVFQYFAEEKVVAMVKGVASLIPGGEMVFDATNTAGLRLANRYVQSTGNTDAVMYFSVDDAGEFARRTGTRLLGVDGFFADALRDCKGLSAKTRLFMFFADRLKRTLIIHLGF